MPSPPSPFQNTLTDGCGFQPCCTRVCPRSVTSYVIIPCIYQAQASHQPKAQDLDPNSLADGTTSAEKKPFRQALIQERKEPKNETVVEAVKMKQEDQVSNEGPSDVQESSEGKNPTESSISVAQHLVKEIRKPGASPYWPNKQHATG